MALAAKATRTARSPAARADGLARSFRHLAWQRIELRPDGSGHAVVTGQRHRCPTTVTVPLDVAAELRRRGVPTVVRHVTADGAGTG